eukprot:6168310-Prymnesium_polylepis.1
MVGRRDARRLAADRRADGARHDAEHNYGPGLVPARRLPVLPAEPLPRELGALGQLCAADERRAARDVHPLAGALLHGRSAPRLLQLPG